MSEPQSVVISHWILTIIGWLAAFALLLLVTGDRPEPVIVPADPPTTTWITP